MPIANRARFLLVFADPTSDALTTEQMAAEGGNGFRNELQTYWAP
jgi:hypothetical protein